MCYCKPEIRTPFCKSVKCRERQDFLNKKAEMINITDFVFIRMKKLGYQYLTYKDLLSKPSWKVLKSDFEDFMKSGEMEKEREKKLKLQHQRVIKYNEFARKRKDSTEDKPNY
tara:strand:+ start:2995 stop:3333 length:339 start_codon:yes stop_codon:yes gene_type:complete